jgi:PTH1 family peptidyl-tRNA hydrolase
VLASRHGARLRAEKGTRALAAECRVGGRLLALATPQTYMNDSGLAVGALVRRHGIEDLRRLVIVHDELDLPAGVVRVKVGGGLAGHNGLSSIRAHIHSTDFVRVRIGIGKPPGRQLGADHVLRRPGKAEREQLDVAIQIAADAVEAVLAEGPEAAMNSFNGRT